VGAATRVRPLWGHPRNAGYLILRGVCGSFSVATNYTAVSLLPLGDAAGINMLKPCVVALAAWTLLGEPLGPAGAAGLAVSLAGVTVLVRPPFLFGDAGGTEWGAARATGTAAAIASCVFSAGVALSIRRIGKSEAALTVGERAAARSAACRRGTVRFAPA
jgi:drug/metabolite transporter (DMT)-like permease